MRPSSACGAGAGTGVAAGASHNKRCLEAGAPLGLKALGHWTPSAICLGALRLPRTCRGGSQAGGSTGASDEGAPATQAVSYEQRRTKQRTSAYLPGLVFALPPSTVEVALLLSQAMVDGSSGPHPHRWTNTRQPTPIPAQTRLGTRLLRTAPSFLARASVIQRMWKWGRSLCYKRGWSGVRKGPSESCRQQWQLALELLGDMAFVKVDNTAIKSHAALSASGKGEQ